MHFCVKNKHICSLLFVAIAIMLASAGCVADKPAMYNFDLNVPVKTANWPASQQGGVQLLTSHYRIFTTSTSPNVLSVLPGFMEGAYRNYHRLTGLAEIQLEHPMTIYMMATRGEWASLARHVIGPGHDKLLSSIGVGGFYWPGRYSGRVGVGLFWNMGGVAALSTAGHEGFHQFLDERLAHRIPTSLEEGLCTLTEGYQLLQANRAVVFTPTKNASRFSHLRTAILADKWVPLEKLIGMDAGDVIGSRPSVVLGFYGQVWALLRFIRSDATYKAGLETMLAEAANGKIGDALGIDPKKFDALNRSGKTYNRLLGLRILKHYIAKDFDNFKIQYCRYARNLARLDPQE